MKSWRKGTYEAITILQHAMDHIVDHDIRAFCLMRDLCVLIADEGRLSGGGR